MATIKINQSTIRSLHPRYWPTWLLLGIMRACAYLPYPIILFLGSRLGEVLFYLLPERRKISQINIALCFTDLSQKEQRQIQKKCFQNIGIAVFETALAWWASNTKLRKLYTIEGLEHIEQAQQQNRPILLLSGHMSCTEIGARLLALHIAFQAMYKPAKNKLYEKVMLKNRSRTYHTMVPRKKTRQLLRNLKNKIITWYAPDQNFGHDETVFAPFFGVPATTLTATSRITQMTNAIVIPFFPYRLPNNQGYKLIIGAPLKNFPAESDQASAVIVNSTIEAAVKFMPDQYLWMHKRFRHRPNGETNFY